MSDRPRLYGLSFTSPHLHQSPQICFDIPQSVEPAVRHFLTRIVLQESVRDYARKYLGTLNPEFFLHNGSFGYLECGGSFEENGRVRYLVNLSGSQEMITSACMLTVIMLLSAIREAEVVGTVSCLERRQLFSLDFGAPIKGTKSRALGGHFDPVVGDWLLRRGQALSEGEMAKPFRSSYLSGYQFPDDSVRRAMSSVWEAIGTGMSGQVCEVGINRSGHFTLKCCGWEVGALPHITSAVYTGHQVRLGCSGPGNVYQQLSVLAGLAALHGIIDQSSS